MTDELVMTQVDTVRIAVAGPAGRLGSAILKAALGRNEFDLVSGITRPGSGAAGMDLAAFAGRSADIGVTATSDVVTGVMQADVLIDVSTAAAAADHALILAEQGGPALVAGVTGYSEKEEAAIAQASERIAIVKARNFSLGVTLLSGLVRQAAERLGPDWDIEVLEMHHRSKADAPSGTALLLGQAAAEGRAVDLSDVAAAMREGVSGPRRVGDIGFATLRGGGVVGDHEVRFAAGDEMITLGHRAFDRSIFAKGALAAARWVKNRKPGLYDMHDVLGV